MKAAASRLQRSGGTTADGEEATDYFYPTGPSERQSQPPMSSNPARERDGGTLRGPSAGQQSRFKDGGLASTRSVLLT